MITNYQGFLESKAIIQHSAGLDVDPAILSAHLKPFQRAVTAWAIRKGRAALFLDAGLGKTVCQLVYAQSMACRSLIIAPLAVAKQTVREGEKFGIPVTYCRDENDAPRDGITITNYQMAHKFDPMNWGAVVLDESGILKDVASKTRNLMIEMFGSIPYRLCCTATPAPNDIAEIGNHAEFLGVMTRVEMLATFFVHDDSGWRLKRHGREAFYKWLASWAMSVKLPSDIGFSDDGYILPPLIIAPHFVQTDYRPDGMLFATKLKGITERAGVRRASSDARVARAVEIINAEPDKAWLIYCGLNDESRAITAALDGAVEVEGSDSNEYKENSLFDFAQGKIKYLVSKAAICGHGMNMQSCARVLFLGLNDSQEQFYQAVRRCYRFGQPREVHAHIVLSDAEHVIYDNVMAKEREAETMTRELIKHVAVYEQDEIGQRDSNQFEYATSEASGTDWQLLLGDSCERLKEIPDSSIDLSVYSPPFSQLYTYSATERDLGNSKDDGQFFDHFKFIIGEMLRITKPGRVTAVHVSDIPAMLVRDGYIGLKDFSGDVVRAYIDAGWTWDARIPIDKNQQAQSIRTHAKGLTMTQMRKDRTWLRPALPDYILKFRKPGENAVPVCGGMTGDEWIELANPTWPGQTGQPCGRCKGRGELGRMIGDSDVEMETCAVCKGTGFIIDRAADAGAFATWYGIHESDTLNAAEGRDNDDGKHICPLQLGTIDRCVRLWSNPGELVFSPFAGIGSELYTAIKLGRKALGIELKRSYFDAAVKNITAAERERNKNTLFSLIEESKAVSL